MPRRSSSPSLHEKKIITMPIKIQDKNLPAIIPQKSSFLQVMKEGVALGIGSSIGHRVVGAFMGPISPPVKERVPTLMTKEYEQCMQEYDDKAVCEKYNK